MRRPKAKVPKTNTTIAVVIDGNNEYWYLEMLKRNERNIRISIKPEIPNYKSIKEQYESVRRLSGEEYTKVFWIIDLDTIIKETNEKPKGKKVALQEFQEYRNKLAKIPNVIVIVNNPCLEFWLLLHFENTSRYFETCSDAQRQLKKHLKDYEKTKEYYTKENHDIYLKLKPRLKTALQNSTVLGSFDNQNPTKAIGEMGLLFQSEELKKFFE